MTRLLFVTIVFIIFDYIRWILYKLKNAYG